MRDILFRAKRIDNNKWVSGGSIIHFLDDGEHSIYIPAFGETCVTPYDGKTGNILGFKDCVFFKVYPETVGQYTGMKDMYGRKIWEDDIAQYYGGGWDEEDGPGVIKWDDDSARFILENDGLTVDFDNCWSYEVKVIGNVYDNSELLEAHYDE